MKYKYRLSVNKSGEPGVANWERVGPLFDSSHEASEYRSANFPDTKKWTITSVRNTSDSESGSEGFNKE